MLDTRYWMIDDGRQTTEIKRWMTEVSKISSKSTPKLRFSVPTNFFYNCRESSTNWPYFLQNKANFKNNQIDVKLNITRDYEKIMQWTLGENKAKQSQSFDFAQDKFSNRKSACPAGER